MTCRSGKIHTVLRSIQDRAIFRRQACIEGAYASSLRQIKPGVPALFSGFGWHGGLLTQCRHFQKSHSHRNFLSNRKPARFFWRHFTPIPQFGNAWPPVVLPDHRKSNRRGKIPVC
jgi:hypothetical protein